MGWDCVKRGGRGENEEREERKRGGERGTEWRMEGSGEKRGGGSDEKENARAGLINAIARTLLGPYAAAGVLRLSILVLCSAAAAAASLPSSFRFPPLLPLSSPRFPPPLLSSPLLSS